MINKTYKHSEITSKIIGCSMEVHNIIGCGFQEVIYQRCLAYELENNNIGFVREFDFPIRYKDIEVGTRRVDFFIENSVMVEIKALSELEDIHMTQALNYLEAYQIEVGLLINFGAKKLEWKRLISSKNLRSN